MKKHDRAIKIIESLIEGIKKNGDRSASEGHMILALEVAISQLIVDEAQKEDVNVRRAGAFYKNEYGKWVRVQHEN